MTTNLAARRHDRAVHLVAWRKARSILRAGGKLSQVFMATPLRNVIAHEVVGPGGDMVVINVGEVWVPQLNKWGS